MKNEIYTVCIEAYNSEAMGVCHIGGRAVFVPRTLVGEHWEIKLVKVSASAVYGRAMRLLEASPARTEPDCSGFGKCGGCDCRHMRYEEELRFKLDKVNNALTRIGKQTVQAEEILGSENTDHYRNKAIFAVAEKEGKAVFGFYRPRSHELIETDGCLLQSELSCRAAAALTTFMKENRIPAYREEDGKGLVRHVFCRQAYHRDGAVVCIVAAGGFGAKTGALVAALRQACPELTGIVLCVNKSTGNSILSGSFHTLWGDPNITDSLCSLVFEIAPQAFFQINPPQAERLYEKAMEYAGADSAKLAFDLYCGAGTISLCLAKRAERVIGCEIVPEAVENARENARRNGLHNTEFICADAGQAAKELAERKLRPDVVVVDPPRKGMDEAAIAAVASMEPERIVYVSCDCATLARDILRFNGFGYALQEATAVDMFPRTCHVESVVCLSRETADDCRKETR